MKRLNLKRLNILNKPTKFTDISQTDLDEFEDHWLIDAEKIETKKLRRWRQQLAS